MERTDPTPDAAETRPALVPEDRGLALFGVLVLVVVFTLLGVGAITLAQRESRNSGSMVDIKSRQSAAYAGLVFALGEFQRDPDNFAALLEAWRTKSVTLYGTLTDPLPPLYLSFSASGGAVALTKTKPAAFTVPGSAYKIVVELAGVQVPSSSAGNPVVVLRATGTGRSGDEQTVLGAYEVRNIRLGEGGTSSPLGITHPFYVNSAGSWNNRLVTSGGDVFLGGETHFNSAASLIDINGGGLKVDGDLSWDAGVAIAVDSSSWVAGNLDVKNTAMLTFKKHLVVDGNATWLNDALLTVQGTFLVQGTGGLPELRGGTLNVGSAAIAPSQLAVTKGLVSSTTGGAVIEVKGDAYLHQIASVAGKAMTLNVSKRLELSDNATLVQNFYGSGTWGQFVARDLKSGSSIIPSGGATTINGATGTSWAKTPAHLALGENGNPIKFSGTAKINRTCGYFPCALAWYLSPDTAAQSGGAPSGVSTTLNTAGFDAVKPPATPAGLGLTVAPADVKEVGFDLTKDPSVLAKALSLGSGGALCDDPSRICGASLNQARTDDIAAGSAHFHNGYFVVRIDPYLNFTWDAVGDQTTPLVGKWLILVYTNLATNAAPWPTTATNADANNPTNIQFIYVPLGSGGAITPGFQPRWKKIETLVPLPFFGYVRVDEPAYTWNPTVDVDLQGAVHFLNPSSTLNTNSSGLLPSMSLNQAVFNSIGAAFGACFTDATTGAALGTAGPTGFVATENWIQFQPLSELR